MFACYVRLHVHRRDLIASEAKPLSCGGLLKNFCLRSFINKILLTMRQNRFPAVAF
jgi:hypothetical protein